MDRINTYIIPTSDLPICPEAQIYFDQVVTNGGADLDHDWKKLLNKAIKGIVDDGSFGKCDKLLALYNQHEIAALTSVVNPSQPMAINVNGGIFTPASGFMFNGINQWIDLNFTPSIDGVNYTLNDSFMGVGGMGVVDGFYVQAGSRTDANDALYIIPALAGTSYNSVNGTANSTYSNGSSLDADYFIVRTDSNNVVAYKNNTPHTSVIPSGSLSPYKLYLCAFNDAGTASFLNDQSPLWWGIGSGTLNIADFRTNFTSQLTGM